MALTCSMWQNPMLMENQRLSCESTNFLWIYFAHRTQTEANRSENSIFEEPTSLYPPRFTGAYALDQMIEGSLENSMFKLSHCSICVNVLLYSIIEGTKESLERLQLDYVDIIFAHRPDPTGRYIWKPDILQSYQKYSAYWRGGPRFQLCDWKGLGTYPYFPLLPVLNHNRQAFYWGTSEWSAYDIEAAHSTFPRRLLISNLDWLQYRCCQ